MIDINLVRENPEKVKEGVRKKGVEFDVEKLLDVDNQRRALLLKVEDLRRQRNELSQNRKGPPSPEEIEKGKSFKEELDKLESELDVLEKDFVYLMHSLPNLPTDDVPEGIGEADNVEVRKWGEAHEFSFKVKDHVELGQSLDILDFENGAKVSGSGFYYLKNEGALLELALVSYGLQFLSKKGFIPIITPDLAKSEYYLGTGYLPKGDEAQTYTIEGSDLGLIATAEVTLAGYHAGQTFQPSDLPKKYGGYSHCFRQEAGAYGKYSKGLYRVHQFTKVEMFAYTKPDESESVHQEFLKLEEDFFQSLGIPFRVLEMCTGDLGSQAAKKYDLEAWMPGRGEYGEVTSTSNTTDYQARNLNIRMKNGDKTQFVHLLNGTLVATSRAIIAILENFQQEDGSVKIPEVLVHYTGFSSIPSK